jgi:hypothetical protein
MKWLCAPQPRYTARWVSAKDLQGIVVSHRMMADHMPQLYSSMLACVEPESVLDGVDFVV